MENVVITPHHSASSEKYMDRAIDLFCLNLQAYVRGESLPSLVDKTAGY
jgi:phosphoglycerate dehydrogenase-like enzyme